MKTVPSKLPNYVGKTPMPPEVADTFESDQAHIAAAIRNVDDMLSRSGAFSAEFDAVSKTLQRVRAYALYQRERAVKAELRAASLLKEVDALNTVITKSKEAATKTAGVAAPANTNA